MSLACLDISTPDSLDRQIIEVLKSRYSFIFDMSAMLFWNFANTNHIPLTNLKNIAFTLVERTNAANKVNT